MSRREICGATSATSSWKVFLLILKCSCQYVAKDSVLQLNSNQLMAGRGKTHGLLAMSRLRVCNISATFECMVESNCRRLRIRCSRANCIILLRRNLSYRRLIIWKRWKIRRAKRSRVRSSIVNLFVFI